MQKRYRRKQNTVEYCRRKWTKEEKVTQKVSTTVGSHQTMKEPERQRKQGIGRKVRLHDRNTIRWKGSIFQG